MSANTFQFSHVHHKKCTESLRRINILNLATCNAENVSGDDELAIIFAQ